MIIENFEKINAFKKLVWQFKQLRMHYFSISMQVNHRINLSVQDFFFEEEEETSINL